MQARPVIVRALGRSFALNDVSGFGVVPLDSEQMVQACPQEWLHDYPPYGLQARIFPRVSEARDPVMAIAPAMIIAVFYNIEAATAALDLITEHFSHVVWSTSWDAQGGFQLPSQQGSSEVRPFPMLCDLRDLMLQGREEHMELLARISGDSTPGAREDRVIHLRGEEPPAAPYPGRLGRPVNVSDEENNILTGSFNPNRGPQDELAARSRRNASVPNREELYKALQDLRQRQTESDS